VEGGVNGFLASNTDEWVEALLTLKQDSKLRAAMGKSGRQKVERCYSLQVAAPQLASLLEEAAGGKS
jgi:glycosyltransferase involved in cell wall biosynthesis